MSKVYLLVTVVSGLLIISFLSVVSAAEKGPFSDSQICKAGIAMIMGRDPAIMKIDSKTSGVIYLSYKRADDGNEFAYKCKLEGERIVWGADDGRWRTHPLDSTLVFRVEGATIHIEDRFSDGSAIKKSFAVEQLGN